MSYAFNLWRAIKVLAPVLSIACATVRHDPLYDGALDIPESNTDSAYLIPVHVENHRTIDALAPHIILSGSGRHDLGIVSGVGGRLDRFIDSSWLGADGCFQITAHYVGTGDLVFDRVCWRRGERIEATLDNVFNPVASWAHR
jgi:hypothetical protein